MSFLSRTAIEFIIFFGIYIVCCFAGDDDVIYKFYDRKPTPSEAIARIRYVLTKGIASIYGGALLAGFLGKLVIANVMTQKLSENQAVLLGVVCIIFFSVVVMGNIQNGIRLLQKRPQRPLIDRNVLRILYRQWFGRRP